MKKIILLLIVLSTIGKNSLAQEVSVKETELAVHVGFWGIWVHKESRLSPRVVMRTEIGFDYSIYTVLFGEVRYSLKPILSGGPKWYYNLNRRAEKGKNIQGNSGNFLWFKAKIQPEIFAISNYDYRQDANPYVAAGIYWGIRRNLGKRFNYEIIFGSSYSYYYESKNYTFWLAESSLRIGYRFGIKKND